MCAPPPSPTPPHPTPPHPTPPHPVSLPCPCLLPVLPLPVACPGRLSASANPTSARVVFPPCWDVFSHRTSRSFKLVAVPMGLHAAVELSEARPSGSHVHPHVCQAGGTPVFSSNFQVFRYVAPDGSPYDFVPGRDSAYDVPMALPPAIKLFDQPDARQVAEHLGWPVHSRWEPVRQRVSSSHPLSESPRCPPLHWLHSSCCMRSTVSLRCSLSERAPSPMYGGPAPSSFLCQWHRTAKCLEAVASA